MIITEVRQSKNGKKAHIYCDGKYILSVNIQEVSRLGLNVGNHINDERLNEISNSNNVGMAKEKAMRFLGMRAHSRKELLQKVSRTFDEGSSTQAVDKMEEIGLVNDKEFAYMYARELILRKRFSKKKTKYELINKGVDREIVLEAIESVNVDEREQITYLLNGKYKVNFNDEKLLRRTVSSLQRLGYNWEDIKSCISECKQDEV